MTECAELATLLEPGRFEQLGIGHHGARHRSDVAEMTVHLQDANLTQLDCTRDVWAPGTQDAELLSLPLNPAGISSRDLADEQVLFLKSHGLVSEDCEALGPHLARSRALEQLYVDFNSIGNAGAKLICEALGKGATDASVGQRLELLSLRHCELGDSGALAVAKLIRSCNHIIEVSVDENMIGDEGALALAAAAGESSSLEHLYVGDNELTAEGIAKLKAALKLGLQIHFTR